jgi:recombination protein RecT
MSENAVSTLQGFNQLLKSDNIQNRFKAILKQKAPGFVSSLLTIVNNNKPLGKVATKNPQSILNAAAIAATLDLPINPNLGFAWIVPYGDAAQFQMGWKGFVQLAQRSGQYTSMNAITVYKSQLIGWDCLNERLNLDLSQEQDEVVGFAFVFGLVNGFKKIAYMTKKELLTHGRRYSKAFGSGAWQTHQDEMCIKTLVKMTLSKWGPLSIEMQTAHIADAGVVKDVEGLDVDYPEGTSTTETAPEKTFRQQVEDLVSKITKDDVIETATKMNDIFTPLNKSIDDLTEEEQRKVIESLQKEVQAKGIKK